MSYKIQKLYEIFCLFGDSVKFLTISTFILIPHLTGRTELDYLLVNGPMACAFIFFSSLAWMELKNRFLFENSSTIMDSSPQQQPLIRLKKSTPSSNFFQILEFSIGTYMTALICLVNVIYGLSLYSLATQWLFDQVVSNSTSLYQEVFSNSSSFNHNGSIQPATLNSMKLTFNFIYFPCLIFLTAYRQSCKQRYPNMFLKIVNKFLKTVLFIGFTILTANLAIKSMTIGCLKPIEKDFYSNVLSLLIFASCMYHLIFKEFTQVNKRNKLIKLQLNSEKINYKITSWLWKRYKNLITVLSLFAAITILYLASRDYKSSCQLSFIQQSLGFDSPLLDKASVLTTAFFIMIIVTAQVMDFVVENSLAVVRISVKSDSLHLVFNIAIAILLVGISSLKVLFLSGNSLMYIWSLSFLLNNFLISSTILVINYFPYQVIIFWNQSRRNLSANQRCSLKEEIPLCRQQSTKRNIDFGELRLKTEVDYNEPEPKTMDIENIVLEHLREIHNRLILDKNLCLTTGQPSMNIGYQALVGFLLFILFTCLEMLIINRMTPKLSSNQTYISIGMLLAVFFFQIFVAMFFLIRNNRETIYIKKLCMRMLLVPYSNLVICFLTVVLVLCIAEQLVLIFLIELFLLATLVYVAYHYSSAIKKCTRRRDQNEGLEAPVVVSMQNASYFASDSSKLHIIERERY